MTAAPVALGGAWAALVLVVGWRFRPRAGRAAELAPQGGVDRIGVADALGGYVLRVVGRPPDGASARLVGRAVLVACVAAAVDPWTVPVVVAGVVGWSRLRAGRALRQRERQVADQLPDVIDLLVLAAGSGLNVALSVDAVGRYATGEVADAFAEVARDQGRGRRLADGLADLPGRLGEAVRPLSAALVDADRYGTPLLPVLEGLVLDVRQQRRRRAEEAARQAPVRLIFPLVLCALPAFGLLTVVPLLLATLQSFRH